ncbi:MAG: shikimate dehydrogenase, partial [Actinomycetales bacterium]
MTARSCGVVGSPIAHSLSPVMHRAAYDALGLDWSYEASEVAEGRLAQHVADLGPSWLGLSVTAPLKREAARLADSSDHVVLLTGVANTLVRGDDGRVEASNTDVPGAVSALVERGIDQVPLVRVLGGGATAASVAHAVAGLGAVRLELVVRDAARADEARAAGERAGLEVAVALVDEPMLDVADLLVSTIPGGTFQG